MRANENKRRAASLALKGAVVATALAGQYFTFLHAGRVSAGHFLYFTNLSNLFAMLMGAVFLLLELRRAPAPLWLLRARHSAAAGIALVFAVFSALLSPLMDASYLASRGNVLVHNLVPWLCALDFLLFDQGYAEAKRSPLPGLLSPLLYYALAFLLSRLGAFFGQGSRFPYFFLDDARNGWFTLGGGRLGVFWWVALMCALQWFLSWGLVYLQRRVRVREASGT